MNRRIFLKHGALALVAAGSVPLWMRDAVFAAETGRATNKTGGRKTLICIFQRGAVDGLSMAVPHGDPWYYKHRAVGGNGIALARTGEGGVLDLDGTFGLNPALAALLPIYKGGHLALIPACGSPSATRSHFDAQDQMESGSVGRWLPDGWLSRALVNCPEDRANASILRGVSLTGGLPRSMRGDAEAIAIPDLKSFGVGASMMSAQPKRQRMAAKPGTDAAGFESLYDDAVGDVLGGTGRESFEAIKIVQSLTAKPYQSAGLKYPGGRFGQSLQQIAQLVKADVGLEVAFAESNGWDTHAGQGSTQGRLARGLSELGQGLAALFTDLGDRMDDVVIVTMSEFGRTARQNGTGGTDHGHGTCFLALGGKVSGGIRGQWPGLAPEQLYENRDLAVTTDYRDVMGEIAQKHFGIQKLDAVFPDRAAKEMKFRDVMNL
ncbi:MAG TPA: DUF1501 domain-containing protein [Abditibacteriaceae bacterium]|jgi:uncharacterized protein (DUF1501 family)